MFLVFHRSVSYKVYGNLNIDWNFGLEIIKLKQEMQICAYDIIVKF